VGVVAGAALMVKAIASVTAAAAELSAEMSQVKGLTEAGSGAFAQMEAQAEKLGRETIFTAAGAAQGRTELARAGFTAVEVTQAIERTLALAAAGNLGLADASTITARAIRQFGLEASEAGRVADVFAKGSTNALTTVQDMGEAVSKFAPLAKLLGVSFEESASLAAVLTERLGDASIAGTSLKNVMAAFMGDLEEGAVGLDEFDFQIARNADGTVHFAKTLENLEKAGFRAEDAINRFGKRGGPAVQIMLDIGREQLDEFTQKMHDAGGEADRLAETFQDNLPGAMKRLTSATSGLKIALGKGFERVFQSVIDIGITPYLNKLTDWVSETGHVKEATILLSVVLLNWAATLADLLAGPFEAFAVFMETRLKTAALVLAALFVKVDMEMRKLGMTAGIVSGALFGTTEAGDALRQMAEDLLKSLEQVGGAGDEDGDIPKLNNSLQNTVKVMGDIALTTEQVIDRFVQFGTATQAVMDANNESITKFSVEMGQIMRENLVGAAVTLGDTLVDAAFGAKVSFKDMAKDMLKQLAQMIVRALLLRAILNFLPGGQAVASVAQVSGADFSGVVTSQIGGIVPGARRGADHVNARLDGGEGVLSSSHTDRVLDGRAVLVGTGGGQTAGIEQAAEGLRGSVLEGDRVADWLVDNIDGLALAFSVGRARGVLNG